MTDQWNELKASITELRDSGGTGTQQEICGYLVSLMVVLEKQMQEPCDDCISRQAALEAVSSEPLYRTGLKRKYADEAVPAIYEKIKALPPAEQWHVIKKRPMTNDERIEWSEIHGYDIEYEDAFIYSNLPNYGKDVLVTLGKSLKIAYLESDGWFEDVESECCTIHLNDVPTAWMPLPEPYKASQTGTEGSE